MNPLYITSYHIPRKAKMPYRIKRQGSVTLDWWAAKVASPIITDNKFAAPTFSMCRYLPREDWVVDQDKPWSERRAINIESYSALVLDFDDGVTIDEIEARLAELGMVYVLYSSFSHQPDHHKFRVIIPFAEPIPANIYKQIDKEKLSDLFPGVDRSCADPARAFFVPSCPDQSKYYHSAVLDGNPLDFDLIKSEPNPISHTPVYRDDITDVQLAAWFCLLTEITPYIGNYADRWRLAMAMRAVGYSDDQILDVVCECDARRKQFNRKWWTDRVDFGAGTIIHFIRSHHPDAQAA